LKSQSRFGEVETEEENTFIAVMTTAPASYDGFGTFYLGARYQEDGPGPYIVGAGQVIERLVLVEKENYDWQVTRYFSGSNNTYDYGTGEGDASRASMRREIINELHLRIRTGRMQI
jgi:hypothetical protein